jgi:hypothetical protein
MFAWTSIALTGHLIYNHLKHYTNPAHQLWIVRILFMVPIYAFGSWMSLRFIHASLYFDAIRDCYEGNYAKLCMMCSRSMGGCSSPCFCLLVAFVIYNFLALCFEYLDGEQAVLNCIKGMRLNFNYSSADANATAFVCRACVSSIMVYWYMLRALLPIHHIFSPLLQTR